MKGPWLLLAALTLAACSAETPSCDSFADMIAGEGEQTFAERYAPTLQFPASERDFIAALRTTKLEWFRIGAGESLPLEAPYRCSDYDMSQISHGYALAGGRMRSTSEYYVVFVDRQGMVVLVENRFGFMPARF
jgi:hypothetical protein